MLLLQAMIDISAESGWLSTTLQLQNLLQMIVQGHWCSQPSLLCLPHIEVTNLHAFVTAAKLVESIPELVAYTRGTESVTRSLLLHCASLFCLYNSPHFKTLLAGKYETLAKLLRNELEESEIEDVFGVLKKVPMLSVEISMKEDSDEDGESTAVMKIDPRNTQKWINVKPDTDYTLNIGVRRSRYPERTPGDSIKAHAP